MTRRTSRDLLATIILVVVTLSLPLTAQAAAPAAASAAQWDDTAEGATWAQFAREAIDANGADLISAEPRDIATFCPNYAALKTDDRRTFWIGLLSALARSESKNNPSKTRWHFYNADAGRPVISRGLFQISIESAHRKIYRCDVAHARDLAQPRDSIGCAVRILDHWVASDGVVAEHESSGWRGAARYWHSFRDSGKRSAIAASTAKQPACLTK